MKNEYPFIKASLWNGKQQLPGTLKIVGNHVEFHFDDFQKSRLNLSIPFSEIERVEEFLLYNVSPNGLKIISKAHEDQFIVNDPKALKKIINRFL